MSSKKIQKIVFTQSQIEQLLLAALQDSHTIETGRCSLEINQINYEEIEDGELSPCHIYPHDNTEYIIKIKYEE